ncbi:MAG TPA: GNAT family N-acetyltransferase [Chloroflexia bacterium]|nr:GNAT family N-acetyltransferase [Chloroflexia bacterium]
MSMGAHQVIAQSHVSEADLQAIRALAALCNAADGLELKVNLSPLPEERPSRFLVYDDGTLVGYASLDGDREPELCGMVHPDHRRRGLGRALYEAVLRECRDRAATEMLVICESASTAGRAFVGGTGAVYDFAEHHMERDAGPDTDNYSGDGRVTVERVKPDTASLIAPILAVSFEDTEASVTRRITADFADPDTTYYLGRLGDTPVGALKVYHWGTKAGIYAFGVLPAYRGQGLGRAILMQTLALLPAEGMTRFALEVETDNTPAVRLYESTGFVTLTTYGYYKLTFERPATATSTP